MTWDSVPWFVGGGAQHSPEVARLLAYAATSGAEGIVTPGDLKVVPLDVPGASVRVLAGACLVLNRSAGGPQQTYVGRNVSEDVKGIAATGSGSGRNDLVVAQIKDPFLPGEPWDDPADVTVGPYIFSTVIPNVPASAITDSVAASAYLTGQGLSAIPLAAIQLPASTGTITASEIKDLRRLARPRTWTEKGLLIPTLDQTTTSIYPAYQQYPLPEFTMVVPEWATNVFATYSMEGIAVTDGDVEGFVRLGIVSPAGGAVTYGTSQYFAYEVGNADGSPERHSLTVAMDIAVPAALKGKPAVLRSYASKSAGSGALRTHGGTQVLMDTTFTERVV